MTDPFEMLEFKGPDGTRYRLAPMGKCPHLHTEKREPIEWTHRITDERAGAETCLDCGEVVRLYVLDQP